MQFGLANMELKLLADAYQSLRYMAKIIDHNQTVKMSNNLFKNLRNE